MVKLIGGASGEEVTKETVKNYRKMTANRLKQLKQTGLSDEKRVLIDVILREKQVGSQVPTKVLTKGLAQHRATSMVNYRNQLNRLASQKAKLMSQVPAKQKTRTQRNGTSSMFSPLIPRRPSQMFLDPQGFVYPQFDFKFASPLARQDIILANPFYPPKKSTGKAKRRSRK